LNDILQNVKWAKKAFVKRCSTVYKKFKELDVMDFLDREYRRMGKFIQVLLQHT